MSDIVFVLTHPNFRALRRVPVPASGDRRWAAQVSLRQGDGEVQGYTLEEVARCARLVLEHDDARRGEVASC